MCWCRLTRYYQCDMSDFTYSLLFPSKFGNGAGNFPQHKDIGPELNSNELKKSVGNPVKNSLCLSPSLLYCPESHLSDNLFQVYLPCLKIWSFIRQKSAPSTTLHSWSLKHEGFQNGRQHTFEMTSMKHRVQFQLLITIPHNRSITNCVSPKQPSESQLIKCHFLLCFRKSMFYKSEEPEASSLSEEVDLENPSWCKEWVPWEVEALLLDTMKIQRDSSESNL